MYDLASYELQKSTPNEAGPTGPRRGPRVVCGSTTEDAAALVKTRAGAGTIVTLQRHVMFHVKRTAFPRVSLGAHSNISGTWPAAWHNGPFCPHPRRADVRCALTQDAQTSVLPSPATRGQSRWTVKSVPRIHKPCETGIDCKDPCGATQHAASAFGLHDPAAWWSPKEPKPGSPLRVPVQTQVATTPLE